MSGAGGRVPVSRAFGRNDVSPESREQGWEARLRRRVDRQAIRFLGAFGIAIVLAGCAGSRAKAPDEASPSQAVPLPTFVPTKAMVLSTSLRGAGAVHVVDLSSGTLLRRIDTGLNPDVAVNRTGSHLLLLSSGNGTSSLSFIDLPSFAERKRISIEDRIQYIGIGPPSLLLSVDERLIFILHRKVLGDNWARVWLTAHDASSGQQRGQLDLGNCGASHLSQGPDARFLYATCGSPSTSSTSFAPTLCEKRRRSRFLFTQEDFRDGLRLPGQRCRRTAPASLPLQGIFGYSW